jgi:hypothetical protein
MSRRLPQRGVTRLCGCGCGRETKQIFYRGHDKRVLSFIIEEVGGMMELKDLVEKALGKEIVIDQSQFPDHEVVNNG